MVQTENPIESPDVTAVAEIPAEYRDLLEQPVTVALATILPSGQPQVTPVWCDLADGHIRVNTDASRQKYRDMVDRPQVTVMALDPANPYRYLEVRGEVVRTEEEGGAAHIDLLAKQYMGADVYPYHTPDERRMICYIAPRKTSAMG
ncbi:MAG: hypothetical protein AVDCRST_MAG49-1176 [uncultured Thermomicrobiales bacterium]|uniref:Pyridoxamine 5'-phosphate oxidase N-terminal domain-containing protein n=1 Tax=uncultured Thermomicrobiales bacterium TaxID=1645740 RepID=A0A6J4UEA4_9BACT|nr:MAG: hypothetical protein AVDCRST_MAG49-1176 [uncultured Thermomicrobiales bacterium]